MADNGPAPKSPAPKWVRTVIAGGFVLVWLVVHVASFLVNGTIMVPFWFTAAGLVVLGYLLGISMDDLTHGLK